MTDATAPSQAAASDSLIAETTAGAVRGVENRGIRVWRGIPFASPPVGPLRLRAPRPVEPWEGVREANEFGAVPAQLANPMVVPKGTNISEDCLTVNVWAPAEKAAKPRPVLVWFYGGAFSTGSASGAMFDGTNLVIEGDVIYVTLNYRLGALGFLDYSSIATPEHPFDSNVGLRDQVAGLEWVRDNIAAFGGDPDNVTIFGESAGGMSVISLMSIPSAKGLFHKAFALSPAPSSMYLPERHAAWVRDYLEILGVSEADAAEAIAKRPWEELVAAFNTLTSTVGPDKHPSTLAASPVVDSDFIPKHAIDAFRDGTAHDVPLIIGTMSREGQLFAKVLDLLPTKAERIEKMFTQTEPDARDRVIAAYPGYPGTTATTDIGGDVVFWLPTVQTTEGHSRHAPTWAYRVDYVMPGFKLIGFGATHGMEQAALFGNPDPVFPFLAYLGGRKQYAAMGQRMRDALFSLARTGDVGEGWPRYDEETRKTRIFDKTDRIEEDPRGERRRAWGDFRGHL